MILPQHLDRSITRHHLQDTSVYSRSTPEEFTKQCRSLNRKWSDIAKTAELPRSLITRLRCEHPVCPVLYVLIKTHKLPQGGHPIDPTQYKVRPIISSIGGPADRISWLLNLFLTQLLKFVPAHLPSTRAFLGKLRNTHLEGSSVMESFDVTSLYTNVSNDDAMQAVHEIIVEHQDHIAFFGLSIAQVMTLINECLQCNIFKWSNEYYRQVRGLAMGQRLAPVLAIAFMSKIERPVLERRPLLYCRYIDDCFIVCPTQNEMDTCFDLLNQQAEHIKLTREKPTDQWLPFLNAEVRLSQSTFQTRWYRKPSNKNIIVHFRSAHARSTKRATVRSTFRTAALVSSNHDLKSSSMALVSHIALSDGYMPEYMPRGVVGHQQHQHTLLKKNVTKFLSRCPLSRMH